MNRLLIAGSDRAWVTELASCSLESGYEVETCADGVDCVARLRASRPEVLVLDATLLWGGSDGVLDFLHEEYSSSRRPIVFLIGDPSWRRSEPSFIPTWVQHLRNPIAPTAVVDFVRQRVEGLRTPVCA